ncbi:FAD-dependent oxidoreductase [Candidatus Weimeria sp. HCP3S3_B5]|uniref:FAD-dependent oxidoreductase n=1 Tax=Candidatus Weimeria sp. HCP3S3_B5 TaxID=3438871 RepID=UPI003F88D183
MEVIKKELIVVGAGPAGLSAAIEAAKSGVKATVFDENAAPGGQLFKQIHKFFGSKEHKAKIRGFRIGQQLLEEAKEAGVEVVLNATVIGLYPDKEVLVQEGDKVVHYKGDAVLVATGAAENMVNFRGWTLPGVIGAGAAQTMMNLHHIKPGNRILMLGTGNVGLVVSFQLIQAGCEVVALADAAPRIGGYGVHAAKVARTGVPFYLSHTIKEVEGTDCVKGVTIQQVDSHFNFIPGTEKHFDVDTVCVAVGLSPMAQLLKMDGIEMDTSAGGFVPKCDETGATSVPGIYAAGDVAGIEEASSAMIEGRMSGAAIAEYLGYTDHEARVVREKELDQSLESLRQGMFAPKNRGKKIEKTEEGIDISENLLTHGFVADDEISRFPGFRKQAKVHPVIECTQNIPCNPCQDACKKGCISIGDNITSLPISVDGSECINCGMCVASCSGQAIFLVAEDTQPGFGEVTIPYEFLPLPEIGDKGYGLSRSGEKICDAVITNVRSSKAFDGTNLVTMKVPMEFIDRARFYKKA